MGTVFRIINADVATPGVRRTRVWLEPGYARVLWPGLMGSLAINRIEYPDGTVHYQPVVQARDTKLPRCMRNIEPYRFLVVIRALRFNEQQVPVAALLEVATDQKLSAPGLQA